MRLLAFVTTTVRAVPALAVISMLGVVGCSTEPATLVITLDAVPQFVKGASIVISGTVSRTPAGETTIVVTAQGGQRAATDTAGANGVFSIAVDLLANQENTIELVATDAKGASSAPEIVVVLHDNRAPRIASMTPTNQADGAPTTGTIEITFDEALVFGSGAAVRTVTAGQTIAGAVTLRADSLSIIVTPQAARRPNSVYVLEFESIADAAGNAIGVDEPACFITAPQDPQLLLTDPADDAEVLGSGVMPADLLAVRLAVSQGLMTGVMEFTSARSYDTTASNNLLAFIELDIDQDASTGVPALSDSILIPFGYAASDTQVEYVIGIDPYSLGGPSFVGEYTAFAQFGLIEEFTPPFCGPYVGFAAQTASFGGDDGNFNFTVVALTLAETGVSLESAPDAGHYVVTFEGSFGGGPTASPPARLARAAHLRHVLARMISLGR